VIELTGKAEEDVIIVIDGNKGTVSIEKAPLEHKDAHVLALFQSARSHQIRRILRMGQNIRRRLNQ